MVIFWCSSRVFFFILFFGNKLIFPMFFGVRTSTPFFFCNKEVLRFLGGCDFLAGAMKLQLTG